MSKAEEIIVDAFTRASVRMHWVGLANLVLAALVMSSVYARSSYDLSLLKAGQIYILDAEEKIGAIERKYPGTLPLKRPNGDTFLAAPVAEWTEKDKKDYGDLTFRQQRAINVLKNTTMGSAEIPIVSAPVSPSDFDIFCGFLMVVLSLWIFFTTNQINYLLKHVKTNIAIKDCRWAIRHILVTMYTSQPLVLFTVTFLVIFLPSIAMGWSTYATMGSETGIMETAYKEIVLEAYRTLVLTKQIITGVLVFFAICIFVMWYTVLRNFSDT
jgi:hypothetical protein